MRNVEFKAELRDMPIARAVTRSLNAPFVAELVQVDTYYKTFNGRLKKREISNQGEAEPIEYIQYERDNRTRPKISAFHIMTEEEFRERYGAEELTPWVTVRKTREVYLLEHARIHLDVVEDLGTFIEFEVLVSRNNNVAQAHETVENLRSQFGPVLGEAISVGYSDLLDANLDQADASQDPETSA